MEHSKIFANLTRDNEERIREIMKKPISKLSLSDRWYLCKYYNWDNEEKTVVDNDVLAYWLTEFMEGLISKEGVVEQYEQALLEDKGDEVYNYFKTKLEEVKNE